MQKITLIISVLVFLIFTGFTHSRSDRKMNNRGASDQKEISAGIYNALKMDDFGILVNYIPGEEELETLNDSEKERYILNIKDYEKFKSKLRSSFDGIIESGIDKKINWSTINLVDLNFEEDKIICRGILQFEDSRQNMMLLYFDLIKIENKWYLLNELKEIEKE